MQLIQDRFVNVPDLKLIRVEIQAKQPHLRRSTYLLQAVVNDNFVASLKHRRENWFAFQDENGKCTLPCRSTKTRNNIIVFVASMMCRTTFLQTTSNPRF